MAFIHINGSKSRITEMKKKGQASTAPAISEKTGTPEAGIPIVLSQNKGEETDQLEVKLPNLQGGYLAVSLRRKTA